ncbi:MAG: hypothetical protein ACRDZY_15765, partial [Acidimicrobiales bacterium]
MAIAVSRAPTATRPPALGPVRRAVRELGLALITLGVIVLLFVGYQLFGTNLTEQNHQAQLKKQFDRALQHRATVPAPVPTSPTSAAATGYAPVVGGGSAGAAPAATAPGGAIDHMII